MQNEVFILNVDYFSLHMRAVRLLRSILQEMGSVFRGYFGPEFIEQESQLPFLVGWIFRILAGSTEAGEAYFSNTRNDAQGKEVFTQVSQIVARFIYHEGTAEIEKVREHSNVFDGCHLEPIDGPCPSPPAVDIKAFNALPRKRTPPTGNGANHWHFSIKTMGPTVRPPHFVYLIGPENFLMHVAAPPKNVYLMMMSPSERVDWVATLLLQAFVTGVLKGNQAHHPKFAPWSWSCDNAGLAERLEEKFRVLGVTKDLCIVQKGSEAHNDLSDENWARLSGKVVASGR